MLEKRANQAGIKPFSPHTCRRTAGNAMVEQPQHTARSGSHNPGT